MHRWKNIEKVTSRQHPEWCAHQKIVQSCALKNPNVVIMPPTAAYGLPRWLQKITLQEHGRAVSFGTVLPSFDDIAQHACAVNVYEHIWSDAMIDYVCTWWRELPLHQPGIAKSVAMSNKDFIADMMLACMPQMLAWGVCTSTGMKIMAHALDVLNKTESLAMLDKIMSNKQQTVFAASLLQCAAKYHWISVSVDGNITCLNYFCKSLHRHFQLVPENPSSSMPMLIDMIYIKLYASL